jgi:ABC-type lipoprotein release transport system permease subunit
MHNVYERSLIDKYVLLRKNKPKKKQTMIQKSFAFIAYRYLFTKSKDTTINFMVKICFIGILVASCSLTLVISVMNGFEKATYEKIQSIYPDLIIDGQGEQIDMDCLSLILAEPTYKIQHFAPQQVGQSLIYNPELSQTPIMIFLRGIDPEKESLVNKLDQKIINPKSYPLSSLTKNNHIIIGSKLAEQANLCVGDSARILYSSDEPAGLHITFQQITVIIGGIFKTGVEEFDNNVAFGNITFFDQLFPDQGIGQVHLKLQPHSKEDEIITMLKKRLNADVYCWKDLYPTLISALKLEKWAMFFILMLIVFVASMNIVSLIFMFVTQKKRDIAILTCLGMHKSSIRYIFITISLIIAVGATSLGLVLAYAVGKALQTFPCIKLPDNIYDTSYLPIKMELTVFSAIFITTIMISFLASVLATRNIDRLHIVDTLKNE